MTDKLSIISKAIDCDLMDCDNIAKIINEYSTDDGIFTSEPLFLRFWFRFSTRDYDFINIHIYKLDESTYFYSEHSGNICFYDKDENKYYRECCFKTKRYLDLETSLIWKYKYDDNRQKFFYMEGIRGDEKMYHSKCNKILKDFKNYIKFTQKFNELNVCLNDKQVFSVYHEEYYRENEDDEESINDTNMLIYDEDDDDRLRHIIARLRKYIDRFLALDAY